MSPLPGFESHIIPLIPLTLPPISIWLTLILYPRQLLRTIEISLTSASSWKPNNQKDSDNLKNQKKRKIERKKTSVFTQHLTEEETPKEMKRKGGFESKTRKGNERFIEPKGREILLILSRTIMTRTGTDQPEYYNEPLHHILCSR